MNDIQIRPATEEDFHAMYGIFQTHVAAGETFPHGPDMDREASYDYWFGAPATTFVAVKGRERVLGMYKLVPNQLGRGSHVASASYMVSPNAQGVGIGHLLAEHSLGEARRRGYLAMQFNYVVSTNTAAIHLWKRLGFSIVGTLPKAYRHRRLGYVDAYVMYKLLEDPARWELADEEQDQAQDEA
ncbi:GNAT family N-acetyltransferase [Massilia sp. TN1-12]|uniref:GNAT family N-acetyltransferase n=1 Tax=Massilia paldalensis TaxID=3377675 RepID=UPI00384FBFA4